MAFLGIVELAVLRGGVNTMQYQELRNRGFEQVDHARSQTTDAFQDCKVNRHGKSEDRMYNSHASTDTDHDLPSMRVLIIL